MKAMEIKSLEIVCDEFNCGWTKQVPFEDIKSWHRKPCPQCHKGILINDVDLAAYKGLMLIYEASKDIKVLEDEPMYDVTFNTALGAEGITVKEVPK